MKMDRDFGSLEGPGEPLLLSSALPQALPGHRETAAQPKRPAVLSIDYTQTRVDPGLGARLAGLAGVIQSDRPELTHTFKLLRSLALQRMRQDGHQVLAVTSPRAIEGKSLTAINLATVVAADLDSTALLIDADLQERRIQTLLGLEAEQGLAEHLQAQVPLSQLLINPAVPRLVLLPAAGRRTDHSAELMSSRVLAHVVQEMRQRYPDRIIVVDLPALLDSADARAFMPMADTALVVVEEHGTSIADLERVAELLAPFNLLGTVVTPRPEGKRHNAGSAASGWRRFWPFARRR